MKDIKNGILKIMNSSIYGCVSDYNTDIIYNYINLNNIILQFMHNKNKVDKIVASYNELGKYIYVCFSDVKTKAFTTLIITENIEYMALCKLLRDYNWLEKVMVISNVSKTKRQRSC